ncbi:hypothetical protein M426DRAFT_318872 [Hypoxylon sp. CI-4A]|nr:hypothetical protein M426DRAFT_318872 [Hypoxylon sp. CI-4A]
MPSNTVNHINTSSLPAATQPGPTSPQHEKDAVRAMSRTNSWKPSLGRRQSYHQEDQKHVQQMTGVQNIQERPGFTECK